jgi:thymidine phosphorylase
MINIPSHGLKVKKIPIDTGKLTVVYLQQESRVYKAQGFQTGERICVRIKNRFIVASLHVINNDWLVADEIGLSEYAWDLLKAEPGDYVELSYADPIYSLGYIRGKIHGNAMDANMLEEIMHDVVEGKLADLHIASFLTACSTRGLNEREMVFLTQAMVKVGKQITWPDQLIVDKHCIGGVPGNRTTMIIVPIVSAFGLMIPKSSSRAITSSAGTADSMEVLAPVDLTLSMIRKVVERERGCIVWGGTSALSPADDLLIAVERELNLDMPEQLVASILSKKLAAGSNHLLIDIPVGPTAKIRNKIDAMQLKKILESVGRYLDLFVKVLITEGCQPIGYGIGPALEARDVLAVLKNEEGAPADLRERALLLAGHILEFSPQVKEGDGERLARDILLSGKAWEKFQRICEAQGGMRVVPEAAYQEAFLAKSSGRVTEIDNRRIAQLAKAAGAPYDKAAGVDLHVKVGDEVKQGEALLTIHAESSGELEYAKRYLSMNEDIVKKERYIPNE